MDNWLNRTTMLIGKENVEKLKQKAVAVFGIGGVGSYTAEALVRSGIGSIMLVDKDVIDITNINRQLIADTTTIGMSKVEVAKQRYLKINPNLKISTYELFYNKDTYTDFPLDNCDYIVDAIDTITSKLLLIEESKKRNIEIISSMGTGNKLDPTKFEISDISKTSVCPLAKTVRQELKKRNIKNVKVVYSKEEIKRNDTIDKRIPSSISFVPSVCGLIIASEVVNDLISQK